MIMNNGKLSGRMEKMNMFYPIVTKEDHYRRQNDDRTRQENEMMTGLKKRIK